MKVFPETNYSFMPDDFNSINYKTVRTDFNGDFRFYSWDEGYIGGFTIKEGLKTNHLVTRLVPEDNNARVLDLYCYQIITTWYSIACGGGACGEPVVIDQTSTTECDYFPTPPSMADPGGGDGGGGDTTGPGECLIPHPLIQGVYIPCNNETEEPEEPEDICEQIQQLLTDSGFKQKMGSLKNAANNSNYEIGYKMSRNTDGTFSYGYVEGASGSGSLDGLVVNSPLDGLIHSHYSGQDMLSIFSLADIFALGALVQEDLINNIDNFVFGVVTFSGTYQLSIDNLNDFMYYFSSNQIDPTSETDINLYGFGYSIYVNPSNTTLENELGLINFIKSNNLGISLFKGDLSNFNSWNKIGTNRQGTTTVNLNCN